MVSTLSGSPAAGNEPSVLPSVSLNGCCGDASVDAFAYTIPPVGMVTDEMDHRKLGVLLPKPTDAEPSKRSKSQGHTTAAGSAMSRACGEMMPAGRLHKSPSVHVEQSAPLYP